MAASLQIVTRAYDFLLYLVPQVAKFPRSERYLVGERLENAFFDLFELLLTACYTRDKATLLQRANVRLEQGRYYVRLCKDLRFVSLHHYEVISKKMNEIGLQLGGWIKSQKGRDAKAQAPV